jgi:hypothetical protein
MACAALFATNDARATDVQLVAAAGATTYASTWRGDFGVGSALRLGVRLGHVIQPDIQTGESYATVNRRINTALTLGVTGFLPIAPITPYGRLFVLHQHEEGLVSVENTPFGFVLGIGSGIRHRAGGGLTIGVDFPLKTLSKRANTTFFVEGTTTYFPDNTLGPSAYFGLSAGVSLDYLLQ